MKLNYKLTVVIMLLALITVSFSTNVGAQDKYEAAIEKWVDVFQPSVLSRGEMKAELRWFANYW